MIVDELAFGVDARPHWLALEPGGKRIVMTGGGTLAGAILPIPVAASEVGGISLVTFSLDAWPLWYE